MDEIDLRALAPTMRRIGFTLAALLLTAPLLAATPAETLAPSLRPLAFLVGSCWRGVFPDGHAADTHCFTADYGGAFVRDRHVVTGGPRPYSGESLYRWDAAERQILFAYYASDGGFDSGRVAPVDAGLDFPDQVFAEADGSRMTLRSHWTRDGADALLIVDEMRTGNEWRPVRRMRLVRVPPGS
ncbi:MAG TPA: hypothetical protein VH331_07910 [Allosphingosinicella sp.]|jgi:hypothetical protein|nr:hypothetical protein [Allosphingosinicella sp.]